MFLSFGGGSMEATETARLAALSSYRILDTEPERAFAAQLAVYTRTLSAGSKG